MFPKLEILNLVPWHNQDPSPQKGIEVISGKIKALSKARYYPGGKRIDVKIICNLKGQVIGCQMIGEERVAERIDTCPLQYLTV
jgi:hypothetical protein